ATSTPRPSLHDALPICDLVPERLLPERSSGHERPDAAAAPEVSRPCSCRDQLRAVAASVPWRSRSCHGGIRAVAIALVTVVSFVPWSPRQSILLAPVPALTAKTSGAR